MFWIVLNVPEVGVNQQPFRYVQSIDGARVDALSGSYTGFEKWEGVRKVEIIYIFYAKKRVIRQCGALHQSCWIIDMWGNIDREIQRKKETVSCIKERGRETHKETGRIDR